MGRWVCRSVLAASAALVGCANEVDTGGPAPSPIDVAAPPTPPVEPMAGMAPPPPPIMMDAGPPDAGAPDTGPPDTGMPIDMNGAGETGRMVGMTAEHNAVRAASHNPMPSPPLPPLKWSTELAGIAQAYAEKLAITCQISHSMAPGLGENIAFFGGFMADAKTAVAGWAGEESCWTFGVFFQTDQCNMACTSAMSSNGCGHYTQLIWRDTNEVGCGVAACTGGFGGGEVWVCNYRPQGNFVGMLPY